MNRACQQCHLWDESELKQRVTTIQNRTYGAMLRAGQSMTDFFDTYKQIRAPFNAKLQAEAEIEISEKRRWPAHYWKDRADVLRECLAIVEEAERERSDA